MTKGGTAAVSTIRAGSQAAGAAWRSTVNGRAARSARPARASSLGSRRRAAWVAIVSAETVLPAAAGGGSRGSRGVAELALPAHAHLFAVHALARRAGLPHPQAGPRRLAGRPGEPARRNADHPGYHAAFRTCLKLAVIGGGRRTRYQAAAPQGLKQAECMRAHGITNYPSPGTLDGGIHPPDFTAIGLDPHTLQSPEAPARLINDHSGPIVLTMMTGTFSFSAGAVLASLADCLADGPAPPWLVRVGACFGGHLPTPTLRLRLGCPGLLL